MSLIFTTKATKNVSRRPCDGRFEIAGRGAAKGSSHPPSDDGVGLPFAYIDGALMGSRQPRVQSLLNQL